MIRQSFLSFVISAVCVVMYLAGDRYGVGEGSGLLDALTYHFCHANIFHLALNLYALLRFCPRPLTCLVGFVSATVAALIPWCHMALPTCGLSGMIMACYARKYQSWRLDMTRLAVINVILAFFPFFNWKIHIVSFILAYCFYEIRAKVRGAKASV